MRPKFNFSAWQADFLLSVFVKGDLSVITAPTTVPFIDETGRMFYDVAKFFDTLLVTGNMKHYPQYKCITKVAEYYDIIFNSP